MKYLTRNDLLSLMKENQLLEISADDETVFDRLEDRALSVIDGYLSQYYNLSYEYEQLSKSRNGFLLRIAIDIFAYEFFTSASVEDVPDIRVERYKQALKDLMSIKDGVLPITLMPLDPNTNTGTEVLTFGSRTVLCDRMF